MQIIGALAGLAVIGTLLLDEGEIVTLETREGDRVYATQLWIIEIDGDTYLRSGRSNTAWLARLEANSEVLLRPTDVPHPVASGYRATIVREAAQSERVNRAMAEKYGFSDVVWSWLIDRTDSVAVRLQPLPQRPASSGAGSAP